MVYNVKIVYTGPAVESIPYVNPICRLFVPNNSYIDTPSYDGTVYDTNVDGFGKIDLMEPYATTSFPFPVPLAQFKLAVVGKYDKKAGGKVVEFRVPSYMEAFWYMQAGVSLADQGFAVEVKPMTEDEAAKKDLSERMKNEVVAPADNCSFDGWLKDEGIKTVGDLQENIDIEWNGNIGDVTGTLKHVDNFNQYSQGASGNFFCVHLDESLGGQKMKVKKGTTEGKEQDFDPDIIIKVEENQKSNPIEITVDDEKVVTFNIEGLELEQASEAV